MNTLPKVTGYPVDQKLVARRRQDRAARLLKRAAERERDGRPAAEPQPEA